MIAPAVILAAFVVFNTLHPAGGLGAPQTVGLLALFGSGPLAYWSFRRLRRQADGALARAGVSTP